MKKGRGKRGKGREGEGGEGRGGKGRYPRFLVVQPRFQFAAASPLITVVGVHPREREEHIVQAHICRLPPALRNEVEDGGVVVMVTRGGVGGGVVRVGEVGLGGVRGGPTSAEVLQVKEASPGHDGGWAGNERRRRTRRGEREILMVPVSLLEPLIRQFLVRVSIFGPVPICKFYQNSC